MNGRMYDPKLGRFLSPDILVQDAGNTQNYNRYSYCVNNPLAYTDPSGYEQLPDGYLGDNGDGRHGTPFNFNVSLPVNYNGGNIWGGGMGNSGFEGMYGTWASSFENHNTYINGQWVKNSSIVRSDRIDYYVNMLNNMLNPQVAGQSGNPIAAVDGYNFGQDGDPLKRSSQAVKGGTIGSTSKTVGGKGFGYSNADALRDLWNTNTLFLKEFPAYIGINFTISPVFINTPFTNTYTLNIITRGEGSGCFLTETNYENRYGLEFNGGLGLDLGFFKDLTNNNRNCIYGESYNVTGGLGNFVGFSLTQNSKFGSLGLSFYPSLGYSFGKGYTKPLINK